MFPHLFLSPKVAPEGATLLAAADAIACRILSDELGAVLRFSLSNSTCGVDVARRLARSRPKFRDVQYWRRRCSCWRCSCGAPPVLRGRSDASCGAGAGGVVDVRSRALSLQYNHRVRGRVKSMSRVVRGSSVVV